MQKILLLLLLGIWATSGYAQSFTKMKDVATFKKKLRQEAKNTQSLQSDFTQIKHLDIMSEDIESKGKLFYKSENKLRWEYTSPIQYMIVMNKGKLTINDGGKISSYDLSANKTFKKVNEMIVKSLQGDIMLEEMDYTYTFKENSRYYLVRMSPKEEKVKEFMKNIQIYFSKKDYAVGQVKIVEQSGDYTLMKFNNKKLNASISDKVFTIN